MRYSRGPALSRLWFKEFRMSGPTHRIVWLLAISTGCIVANIYYVQPLLADIAHEFGLSVSQMGAVAMLAQMGTGLGMLFFVPLGDKYERRSLISTLLVGESIALAAVASSANVIWLSLACFFVGALAATVHVIVPLAAHIAPPKERGRVVGTVLSGLLIGVLLARTFSGITGAQYGWRTVYWFASLLMLALAVTIRISLDKSEPEVSLKWAELMRSVWSLARQHATLREAALLACLLFMSFSALWTTLVFLLRTPPYHYGTTAAGLFGLLGASSAAAAPFFGRMLPGLIVSIALIDIGVQSGHVANQSRIYSLAPEARSRINTFYMVAFFIGGSLGSYLGPLGFNRGGWTGFCAIPLTALIFALAYFLHADRRRSQNRLL